MKTYKREKSREEVQENYRKTLWKIFGKNFERNCWKLGWKTIPKLPREIPGRALQIFWQGTYTLAEPPCKTLDEILGGTVVEIPGTTIRNPDKTPKKISEGTIFEKKQIRKNL